MRGIGKFASVLLVLCAAPLASAQVRVETVRQDDGGATLVHEVIVAAPVSDVWLAISTLEGWKTWSVPIGWEMRDATMSRTSRSRVHGSNVSSGRIVWETSFDPANRKGSPNNVRHLILGRVPERLMVFRTIQAPRAFRGGTALPEVTWVLELQPRGNSTLVRITGAGFAATSDGRAALAFFQRGNEEAMDGLRRRFVDGPRDWGARTQRPDPR